MESFVLTNRIQSSAIEMPLDSGRSSQSKMLEMAKRLFGEERMESFVLTPAMHPTNQIQSNVIIILMMPLDLRRSSQSKSPSLIVTSLKRDDDLWKKLSDSRIISLIIIEG